MHAPLSISFNDLERSHAVEARARETAERLMRQHERVTRCHITVDGRAEDGDGGAVRIHVCMPGAQIHAARRARTCEEAALAQALSEAYLDIRRQLRDLDGQRSTALIPVRPL